MHGTIANPHARELEFPWLRLVAEDRAYDPRGYDPQQVARLSWAARMAVKLFAMGRISRLLRHRSRGEGTE